MRSPRNRKLRSRKFGPVTCSIVAKSAISAWILACQETISRALKPLNDITGDGSLYATEWCGYCKMTRAFFAANGIRYTEYDIEKSSEALKQHRKLGGNGVPLIVVGDDVIKGWNEGALRQLLQPWIKG